jgi:hypothetical protein
MCTKRSSQDACRPRAKLSPTHDLDRNDSNEGGPCRASAVDRTMKTAGWRLLSLSTSLRAVRITRRARSSMPPAGGLRGASRLEPPVPELANCEALRCLRPRPASVASMAPDAGQEHT